MSVEDESENSLNPDERLAAALKVLKSTYLKELIRKVWAKFSKEGSIFWDAEMHQIEVFTDELEITVRERR